MNIQEYISSGIVESYVLGLAEIEERVEFERMCVAHAEVKAARDAFEALIEQNAVFNAIEPPKELKDRIWATIVNESRQSAAPVLPIINDNKNSGSHPDKAVVTMNWMRYLVAASIILLVASTGLNVYFFKQYKDYSTRYADLLANQQQLTARNDAIQAKLQSYETDIAIMKDPDMAVVKMPQVPTSPVPGSLATVYWNLRTKDVYLLINNMPEPTLDRQYQLWALVDGKPVDAGVFDIKSATALVKMKNIPNAQTFAITLEKRGGSVSPTMEQLYVLGNVKT